MKFSCLVYLGIFAGVGILVGIALVLAIPPPPPGFSTPFVAKLVPSLGVGFLVSAFFTVVLWGLRDTVQRLKDRAHLAPGNVSLPIDGERTAVVGRLVADGPLVESPFTSTACASYSYEVRRMTRGRNATDVQHAWGYALTPAHVQAPWGTVRIMSYTNIEESPPELADPDVRRRAAAYFAANPLVLTGVGASGLGYDAFKTFHEDQDGTIRGDFGGIPDDFMEGNYRLYEKVLLDGETITAIGTWDSQLGGLKAEPGHEILSPIVVRRGPADKTRSTLLKQAIGGAIFAFVLLGIAGAIVWAFLRNVDEFLY